MMLEGNGDCEKLHEMYVVVAVVVVVGALVLRWHVLFQFCMAHRRPLELLYQLPSLVCV